VAINKKLRKEMISMKIISHRGLWYKPEEKNTIGAFIESFKNGFGTETDIRDCQGTLVISHDMPNGSEMTVEEFFELYNSFGIDEPLALNIKADGMSGELARLLVKHNIENYFVFDMSVPDSLSYIRAGLNPYTRQSEYEITPSCYDQSVGVWMDEFQNHWINQNVVSGHLENNKVVAIVSPELHKRPYLAEWHDYKAMDRQLNSDAVILCTDFPLEAKTFFAE
jgi:hypothetical protein